MSSNFLTNLRVNTIFIISGTMLNSSHLDLIFPLHDWNFMLLISNSQVLPPQALVTTIPLPDSINLTILDTSCRGIMQYLFFCD